MLTEDDFSDITLKDRDFFRELFSRYPQEHSDNSFVNMVCWNHYAHYEYAQANDSVVIKSTINGESSFRGPIGPQDPDFLRSVLELAADVGGANPFYIFDDLTKTSVNKLFPELPLYTDRNFSDYIYRTEDLAFLQGGQYLSIRRHVNKFWKKCNARVETMTPDSLPEVREFLERWCEWKHCEEQPVLGHEKDAVLYGIKHFTELGLGGILLRAGDHISAMAIYEITSPEMAVIHFEKGLPDCKGIYKVVNQETAKYLHSKHTCNFINRESDLGIPGLREAKTRYHPHHFAPVNYCTKEELRRLL